MGFNMSLIYIIGKWQLWISGSKLFPNLRRESFDNRGIADMSELYLIKLTLHTKTVSYAVRFSSLPVSSFISIIFIFAIKVPWMKLWEISFIIYFNKFIVAYVLVKSMFWRCWLCCVNTSPNICLWNNDLGLLTCSSWFLLRKVLLRRYECNWSYDLIFLICCIHNHLMIRNKNKK